jgi:nitrate/nitrite transporter NarK
MSTTQLGLIVGLTLGIVAAFGGFGAFVVAVILGAIGLGVGRLLEGRVDLNALFSRDNRR